MGTLLALALAGPLALQAPAPAPPPKRVLVYTHSAGFEHEVVKRPKPEELSLVERTLLQRGRERGWFEAVVTRDAGRFSRAGLADIDLVFFYTSGELPWSEAQRAALFEFVASGKGFAGAHPASDTFHAVPEYGRLVGGYFDNHPWHEKVQVEVEVRDHPATRHLGASFEIVDEIYQFKAPWQRQGLRVLLRLDPRAVDLKREGVHRTDRDFALAWCRDHERGRVFYTALGHRPEVWADERFLKHLEGGMAWASRAEERFEAAERAAAKLPKEPAPAPPKETPKEPPKLPPKLPKGELEVPAGFAADLVAESPELRWPTALVCLDDGTLLVGEDRMDMPGPVDQPVDRILALSFHPDGTHTTREFAKDLYAVMGLELVDGDVYVVNMPRLTRLVDRDRDGVVDERHEVLTDLGPQPPGHPGGFNDHIVSGLKLGLDGFLYIAVGDKGIPLCHGTDGRTLTLRGGGVIRVMPDGSRLSIVARGLRNVLDVAIDERGELFTYDNTDDGLGWWTRLSHVVYGGDYGYPWGYRESPEWYLPCMAEYGGGSPCGGLVYREAAWPAEYRGDLFFCEWGKGTLRRFELAEQGASFRVTRDEDFVRAGGVKEFKPFDVCESPDGRFLYVSDWAYDGWQKDLERGRLWRIRRADDDARRPSTLAALPADADGLIAALGDPSYRRRSAAHRAIGHCKDSVRPKLRELLESRDASVVARRHAVWAVSALVSDAHARQGTLWAIPAQDDVLDQYYRSIGARQGVPLNLRMPPSGLRDPDPRVRAALANAIAQIAAVEQDGKPQFGAPSREDPRRTRPTQDMLESYGSEPDPMVRWALGCALQSSGTVADSLYAWSKLRRPGLVGFRDAYSEDAVDELKKLLVADVETEARVAAVELLARIAYHEAPWDGSWWNIQPAKSPPPKRDQAWSETLRIVSALAAAVADREREVQLAALRELRKLGDRDALAPARDRIQCDEDEDVRCEALRVIEELGEAADLDLLARVVRDPRTGPAECQRAVAAAAAVSPGFSAEFLRSVAADEALSEASRSVALEGLARVADTASRALFERCAARGAPSVRKAALRGLARMFGREAGSFVAAQLADADVEVVQEACRVLAELGDERQVAALLPLLEREATRSEAILALAARPDERALRAYVAGLASRELRLREASQTALAALGSRARPGLEALHAERPFDEALLAAVQAALQAPQPVLDWRVHGPVARGPASEQAPELAELSEAPREVRADLRSGRVDLGALPDARDEVTAFAVARLHSTRARRAELSIGSDDGVRVWLDGRRVHVHEVERAWAAAQDRVPVELPAGESELVVEVWNARGQWAFSVAVEGEAQGPLFERRALAPDLEAYRRHALEQAGDPLNGARVFRQVSGPMCIRCHVVFGSGTAVGPELSDVAARFDRAALIESILAPSARIAEGYRLWAFELDDGRELYGQLKREDERQLEIYDNNGELRRVERATVVERSELKTSLMPEGLAPLMSRDEFADLVAYLSTLRGAPK